MAVNNSSHQRDAKVANLRAQARNQKLELDALIKRALTASANRGTASGRGRGHAGQQARSARILDSDVEFTRKNLRNTYLTLLFSHTFNRLAHGVDNLLWTDTSYCLISAFRTLISTQQKASAAAPANARSRVVADVARTQLELRKLLQDEEAFWQDLAARIIRIFSLDEARPNLEALGIPCDSDGDTTVGTASLQTDSFGSFADRRPSTTDESLSQAALLPANRSHLTEIVQKALIFCGDLARYRELHCLSNEPAESDVRSSVHRGARGATRGRGGRPAAAAGPTRKGTASAVGYEPDFSKASAYYEQARLLLPDHGNPSNQLAVIATYNSDLLLSTYHCYRALCVRLPFEKAKVNLDKTLAKPMEAWLESGMEEVRSWNDEQERQARSSVVVERLSSSLSESEDLSRKWLDQVVILHGLFFHRVQLDCIMPLSHSVLAHFSSLVRARALPADQIVRVVVTGLCASWTTRLWRNTPSSTAKGARDHSSRSRSRSGTVAAASGRGAGLDPASRLCIEHQILAHVLGLFRELADVSVDETQQAVRASRANASSVPAGAAGGTGAVRHLTAVVRRMLPALRVATKWMKTHLEYIQRSGERASASSQSSDSSMLAPMLNASLEAIPNEEEVREAQVRSQADLDAVKAIDSFWRSYVSMINMLRYAFPFETLPNIGKAGPVGAPALCLEEDSDMRGLTPTKKALQSSLPGGSVLVGGMGEACSTVNAVRPSQVHPNEEQLMRIADLLIDAKVVAESDASPIQFDDEQNLFIYESSDAFAASQRQGNGYGQSPAHGEQKGRTGSLTPSALREGIDHNDANPERQDEASSEGFSEMTDDPVELAMRAVDGHRTGEGSVMDQMEESMREVQVNDPAEGVKPRETILVPSQVRIGSLANVDGEAARLFAQAVGGNAHAYPGTTGRAPPDLGRPSPATTQHLLLQMLQGGRSNSSPVTLPSDPSRQASLHNPVLQPQLLFGGVSGANGSPDGLNQRSIWSPGPADSSLPVGSPPQQPPAHGASMTPSGYPWGLMPEARMQRTHELAYAPAVTPSSSYGFGSSGVPPSHLFYGRTSEAGSGPFADSRFGSPYGEAQPAPTGLSSVGLPTETSHAQGQYANGSPAYAGVGNAYTSYAHNLSYGSPSPYSSTPR